jgi:hypothetical protein
MDDRGFIFTMDATLALVILIVFTASIATYYMLPTYMGSEHQHLEVLAEDALEAMQNDGTLYAAAVKYAEGDTAGAEFVIEDSMNNLVPSDVAYKLTIGTNPSLTDNKGILTTNDITTRVKVISGPREGWMGRAWYKLEEATLEDQTVNVTTTMWNFHNWLTNFEPWSSYQLYGRNYWGSQQNSNQPVSISYSIPPGSTLYGAQYLVGADNRSGGLPFGSNLSLGGSHIASPNQYTFLNVRPGSNERMYNYRGNITAAELQSGSFYLQFLNITSAGYNPPRYDMPWFALIGNYSTTIQVPSGVMPPLNFTFPDTAGLAFPSAQDLDGDGIANEYGRQYDLNTGTVTSIYDRRVMSWSAFEANHNVLDNYDDGVPFAIADDTYDDTRSISDPASAVSVVTDINIPDDANVKLLDSYLVLNTYGAVDNAMIEVWNGTQWVTAFCSFDFEGKDYTAVSDGYGNIPGIIFLGSSSSNPATTNLLKKGNNKVRITIWDLAPGNDYDLVGLVNCYARVTYTRLPIDWRTFQFSNYQDSDNSYTTGDYARTFTIAEGAKKAYLFVGTGTDTRHLRVQITTGTSTTWRTLYDSNSVPFVVDLGYEDASRGYHILTSGPANNYTLKTGNTYRIRVTVTGPSNYWESGDWNGNAEIFSGTRVAILYPEFLANVWTASYANDAQTAKDNARQELVDELAKSGIILDPNDPKIQTEALFTGNLPNAMPVRIDLWRG